MFIRASLYTRHKKGIIGTSIQLSINLNKPIDCTYIHNGYQFDAFLTLRYGMFVKIFKIRENNERWEILRFKLNLSSESFETCPAVTDSFFQFKFIEI